MTSEEQLDMFIDRFSPEVAANARAALAMVAARLPGAVRLVIRAISAKQRPRR